jgi:hypothetical protein
MKSAHAIIEAFLIALLALVAARPVRAADDDRLFREKVAPILKGKCVRCHAASSPKGGLKLTTAAGMLKGGKSGPPVEPAKPDESLLLAKITGDPPEMPLSSARSTPIGSVCPCRCLGARVPW